MEEFARKGDQSNTMGGFQFGTLVWRSRLCLRVPHKSMTWFILSYLSPSLRLNFFGGNIPAFFNHFISSMFPFPLFVCSFLLSIVGSRERRVFSLIGTLRCLTPNLGLHHFHQATSRFALYAHSFKNCCIFL